MTYVIAEVGPNHNGSVETAVEFIERLAPTGVDAVKFQLSKPENAYSADAFKVDYQKRHDDAKSPLEMARRYQLPFDDHQILVEACRASGVDYLCTAFEMESLRFLEEQFEMPYVKIPSGEIHSVDMLDYIGSRHRPVLLSTGASSFEDIERALNILEAAGTKAITILHCVSNYPAPADDIHLNVIPELKARFGYPVGYSDHTLGNDCALAAVSLGAIVVEKHVTLDRNAVGPDHQASATIDEVQALVASIRTIERALGGRKKVFSEAETKIRGAVRKSIVAARDIEAGAVIVRDDLCFKRPGNGISPLEIAAVVGRTARRPMSTDRLIQPDDLDL